MNITAILLAFLPALFSPAAPEAEQQHITLAAQHLSAATGETVCQNISVADFRQMLSMQYSIRWDSQLLTFVGLSEFGLPGLNNNNFGTHRTEEGILTFVWIDNDLQGIDLPDGSTIFQICFQVKGNSGSSSPVVFAQQPTPFEAVNLKEELVDIIPVDGSVTVR